MASSSKISVIFTLNATEILHVNGIAGYSHNPPTPSPSKIPFFLTLTATDIFLDGWITGNISSLLTLCASEIYRVEWAVKVFLAVPRSAFNRRDGV